MNMFEALAKWPSILDDAKKIYSGPIAWADLGEKQQADWIRKAVAKHSDNNI